MSENMNEAQKPEQKSNRTMLLIILIILLAAVNIYLYVKLSNKKEEVKQQTEIINMDSLRIADLNVKYNSALSDIESLKGQNNSLDSLLTLKATQINNMKSALDAAKKAKKISDEEYAAKVAELQNLINDLKGQITTLEKEKNILVAQKDSIGRDLDIKVGENMQLKKENKVFKTEAGLLKAQNIEAIGSFSKKNGKEITTNKAKNSERIKVCFDVDESKSSDAGSKTFYLRIISPEGVTLAVQSLGSGVITLSKSGEQVQYTITKEIEYTQQKQNVCIYWKQNTPLPKGNYTAEIYQDGYKVGSKDFTLK